MYHVEDHTHEDYKLNSESETYQYLDNAVKDARRRIVKGQDVRIFYQSHDSAPMTLVPEAEWDE